MLHHSVTKMVHKKSYSLHLNHYIPLICIGH
nr:MAG TPA: hypothetical protein [Caudoviricetes sp.]DAQ81486.1 MAG TPA: hypothetical protein [Caudoviricetes sp.]